MVPTADAWLGAVQISEMMRSGIVGGDAYIAPCFDGSPADPGEYAAGYFAGSVGGYHLFLRFGGAILKKNTEKRK